MSIKIAINGFGRIGRLVFRRMQQLGGFDIVAINDITDSKTLAHLLKYDSVHRQFNGSVVAGEGKIMVNGKDIPVTAEKDPSKLRWREFGAEIVVEGTGIFTSREKIMNHINAGARKVVLTAPAKDEIDATIVLGVNENVLTGKEQIVSNASCTTNCLAPMVKVLNDNFKIHRGLMTTVHAYTNDQRLLDLPHGDLRRARAAGQSIIPTTTGAAKAVSKVIPSLKGRLDGTALRVPLADGSITDFVAVLEKEVSKEEINQSMKMASESFLKGILEYTTDEIVSSDIIGNSHSCIFDSQSTMTIGNIVKVMGWYDNEWGYSCRVVDLIKKL